MNIKIDLGSDTVTRPTPAMLDAMMTAKVGDDMFGEDPTVAELEAKAGAMFGKEDALFCPSGTMTNQIAINVHVRPGDELICDDSAHIYNFEGGGIARNSGASVKLINGKNGRYTAEQAEAAINPNDIHHARTAMIEVENTVNKGGGGYWDFNELVRVREVAKKHKLVYHLDGARLFNALVATGETPLQHGELFDTVSICLSKGLGAPVGSLLLCTTAFRKEALRVRKAFGGAMRQAGFLAAAGIFALDNNIDRLAEDHHRASIIGETLAATSWVDEVYPSGTNIVIFKLSDSVKAQDFMSYLEQHGVRAFVFGPQTIRFVTHLDFTDDMLTEVVRLIKTYPANC